MHELLCTCLSSENALTCNLRACNFQNFLGGMPPDPLVIACFACWLCFAQQSYLDTCSYNFKFGSYFFGLTTSNLLPPALYNIVYI